MEAQEAVGAVRSTVTEEAVRLEAGPALPDESETEEEVILSSTVPSEQEAAVTVKDEPEAADEVKTQSVAVPAFMKSADVRPETPSEKVSV